MSSSCLSSRSKEFVDGAVTLPSLDRAQEQLRDDLLKLQRHPPVEPTAAQKRFWQNIPLWLRA